MSEAALFVMAFLAGLTFSGLVASAGEAAIRAPAGFREPWVTPQHIARSLAVTAVAGPAMLLNEIMAMRQDGQIGALAFWSAFLLANGWALALGILVLQALWTVLAAL